MSIENGPIGNNNPIPADNLEKAYPAAFEILKELAGFNDKEGSNYATALAQNLVYEFREDPELDETEQLEALVGYLMQFRFNHIVGRSAALALKEPDNFAIILLQTLFEFEDEGFIIDVSESDETHALRKLILDIQREENVKENIDSLKKLFTSAFEQPRIIAPLLPFYHDFLQQPGKRGENNEAKKSVFIELFASTFIEEILVGQITEEDDADELKLLTETLKSLRKTQGLYDSLISSLDKALPQYKLPTFSAATLALLHKQYHACQAYLTLEKNTQVLIADWSNYVNTFGLHSPLRELFSHFVSDLDAQLEYVTEKIVGEYRSADEVSAFVTANEQAFDKLITPYEKLIEKLDPFRERALQLAKIFKQLASDFPEKSPRDYEYQDLRVSVLEILSELEKNLAREINEAKNTADINKANRKLTLLIKDEMTAVVAGQTPLQRIADQLGKTIDPKKKEKLGLSLERLKMEGADLSASTEQYRSRATTTILGDVASSLVRWAHPLRPRSRSAGEIAAMHGASPEMVEKLTPRPPELPKSSGWSSRISPKNVWKTAGYYFAIHRRLAELLNSTLQFVRLQKRITPPASSAPRNAGSLHQLLEGSGAPHNTTTDDAASQRATTVNFGKGSRMILPAPRALPREREAVAVAETKNRKALAAH